MGYSVFIKNNETLEIREYKEKLDWDDSSEYWWTDGNMGCDCNRGICFDMANGVDVTINEYKCGESKFSIEKIVLKDGTVITL